MIDSFPFGIQFTWDKDGEANTSVLFERGGPIPSTKMLTFLRYVHPVRWRIWQLAGCL